MIVHVAQRTAEALARDRTYVATDDDRIRRVVEDHGFKVVMTSSDALTGTDRIAQAAEVVKADIYVNVQGDEPMLDPASIRTVVELKRRESGLVINAMAPLAPSEDVQSVNIPKVVTNESKRLLYMSRSAIPGFKDRQRAPQSYWKQICIYAFTREELRAFAAFGRKSALERSEDIEILRFFELGIGVQMVEVAAGSLAVDEPDDVPRVEVAMGRLGPR
jgi:3-deoxy-manno-octulosonate cytidylyltransferase (CMP-KDO synthetase)